MESVKINFKEDVELVRNEGGSLSSGLRRGRLGGGMPCVL